MKIVWLLVCSGLTLDCAGLACLLKACETQELKVKSPTIDFVVYVSAMGIIADGMLCYKAPYNLASCKHAHQLK